MILEVASVLSYSEEFQDVYGMRFMGLEDPGGAVYHDYRVPDAEAPYPQDIVIDQNMIVRHWSWEYDPQEIIETIDGLLGSTSVPGEEERPPQTQGKPGLWLAPASPNPFRPGTDLHFRLSEGGPVRLAVYDTRGRLVRALVDGEMMAGDHFSRWDGRDSLGHRVASGVYFIELFALGERQTRRAVLLR